MNRENEAVTMNVNTFGTASVAPVLTPEQIADATMRRLRAEIIAQHGTVKAFASELKTIRYEALNDNLAGRSDMKLSVLYECLAALGLNQVEFATRVMQDASNPQQ